MRQTDFLVIGSGIAGLTYALKVAHHFPDKKVLVMTKAAADETNTKYAQGGIAVVNDMEHDSFEKHIEDTLIAGDGLCNEKVVEIVVKEGRKECRKLLTGAQGLIKNRTAIINGEKKAAIQNSEYCIIKMLPAEKWKGR
jgi:L-aspartate oxidase